MLLNRHQFSCLRASFLTSAILFLLPTLVFAQTTFVGPGTTWEDASNWDNGAPSGQNANINGGFSVTLGSTDNILELDIAGDQGVGDGQLDHSAGALGGSNWLKVGGQAGRTGTYNLSGTASASGFEQGYIGFNGGVGNLSVTDNASFEVDVVLKFGSDAPDGTVKGTGHLDLSGSGSVFVPQFEIQFFNDSTGVMTGGSIGTNNRLQVFDNSSFNMSGGSATVDALQVSNDGEFDLSNGPIMAGTGIFENNAVMTQSGGSLTTDQWVSIGNVAGETATYNISAGSLTSNGDWLSVGENGGGDLKVSDTAAVDSNGDGIIVGRNGTGVGLLEIDGSGASVEGNDLRVGINSDGDDDGGTGTLSWIADAGGVADIVSLDNTEFGANANLLVNLTADANFSLFGAGATLQEILLIDNAASVSGTFAGLGEGDSVDIGDGKTATISYFGGGDNFDVVLQVQIPEPSSVLLLGLGAWGLAASRRRRK